MGTKPLILSLDGQEAIPLNTVSGTLGHLGIDLRALANSGMCSFDPGFSNTAGCESAISYIDTENSVLLHRGYPVDQLARQCEFLEVAYIMLHGEAPDEERYQVFREKKLPAIPWCMSRCRKCAADFGATPIRWR